MSVVVFSGQGQQQRWWSGVSPPTRMSCARHQWWCGRAGAGSRTEAVVRVTF